MDMDIEPSQPILKVNINSQQKDISTIPSKNNCHLIPVKAKQQVINAQAKNYFDTTIHSEGQNILKASLLGNSVKGTKKQMKDMYEGVFIKQDHNVELSLLHKIEEITEWRKDRIWGQNDGRVRLIEKHIELQNVLHEQLIQ